jgi:chromatin remodeling complex protein RSC6
MIRHPWPVQERQHDNGESAVCAAYRAGGGVQTDPPINFSESLNMATAKPAAKKATAAKTSRQPSAAFMKPLTPSAQLAAVVGAAPMPRTEVVKKLWDYIKAHKLQDTANKRMINADAKLKPVFGKDQVSMFEMTKLVSAHLK